MSPEEDRLAAWLTAALEDPNVCEEFKTDIENWLYYIEKKNENKNNS